MTPILIREKEIKLQILRSLAQSQQALTRIIEQVALGVEASPQVALPFIHQVELLTRYQQVLADKITQMDIRQVQVGVPQPPWINAKPLQGRLARC